MIFLPASVVGQKRSSNSSKESEKKGLKRINPEVLAKKGSKITFSEKVIQALKNKVSKHNEKYPSKKVTLSQQIYRRGAGAFSLVTGRV